jgi:hypothetical protein
MQTYTCPSCKFHVSEADKLWDSVIDSGRCPYCRGPLRNFPVPPKQQEETPPAQQTTPQEERPATQQPYPWGSVLVWTLFSFLLGLVTAVQPWKSASSIDRGALRMMAGIVYAAITALIVGILKFFKRTPDRLFFGAFGLSGDAQSADKTVFRFSIGLAIWFTALALYLQQYIGLVDAGVCGLLGVGVKHGSAPSRWLLAVYAFISPILVIFLTDSPGGALWPFFFFAVCQSILAHQKESQLGVVNVPAAGHTSQGAEVPTTDTAHNKLDQTVGAPKPAITLEPVRDRQFNNDSTGTCEKATPLGASKTISFTQPTANPIVLSIPAEPSQNTIEAHEERLYEQIAQELDTNTLDKGLWTKAYAQAGGDDQQTRVLYIKARFARLRAMENARGDVIRQDQEATARLSKTKDQIEGRNDV